MSLVQMSSLTAVLVNTLSELYPGPTLVAFHRTQALEEVWLAIEAIRFLINCAEIHAASAHLSQPDEPSHPEPRDLSDTSNDVCMSSSVMSV